uniref:Protein kinase domain-containing protein n=1 Tax=Fagus sylvatica TaxID=28930 RepID=A0A2N9ITE1_FAGSY
MFWYKGSLEGRTVFVKPFNIKPNADFVINDLVISAQMCAHINVLKPIGCCLETHPPIQVYEFAANGILQDRIYVSHVTQLQHQPMAWPSRLKIARQIAHAISYLHTAFARPIIHMAIHMRNILLDEHDVPKLCNFFFSVSIPEGEIDVKADDSLRVSMFNNIPEFEATGKVTEKSDVYKFGVFLLELLTGDQSYSMTRLTIDECSSSEVYIHNSDQGCCINEIVDPAILAWEGGASLDQQLQAVLQLALTCTEDDPQRRPTMVDVTKELRRIERFSP